MKAFICFCVMLLSSMEGWAAFLAGTDIPLMENLSVDESEGFSFDTPVGQITTFVAKTTSSAKQVYSFYQTVLEELGWKRISVSKYERDSDELELQISEQKEQTLVKIQLTFVNK